MIERKGCFNMILMDKLNSVLMRDAYYGAFIAPDKFGKYCCLDTLYSQFGVVGSNFIEAPYDMSVKELARYNTQKGVWLGYGVISKQMKGGSCGFRVLNSVSQWMPIPERLGYFAYNHKKKLDALGKTYLIVLTNKFSDAAFNDIVDVKYADEMEESLGYCKDWLMKQTNSSCMCYIAPKNERQCLCVKPVYKDIESLEQNNIGSYIVDALYSYNFYMLKQGMRMERL